MCFGIPTAKNYEYWKPYYEAKYGTEPLPRFVRDALKEYFGKNLEDVSVQEIHKALKELDYEELIV